MAGRDREPARPRVSDRRAARWGSGQQGSVALTDTQADPGWLAGLITRPVPLARWQDAYNRGPGDIKTVLSFQDAPP